MSTTLVVGPHEATTLAYHLPELYASKANELAEPTSLRDITDATAAASLLSTITAVARDLREAELGEAVALHVDQDVLDELLELLLFELHAEADSIENTGEAAGRRERQRHVQCLRQRIARAEA